MKKKILCMLLSATVICGIFAGCSAPKRIESKGENLAINATFATGDKTSNKFSLTNKNKEVKVKLPSPVTFNTIVLNETTENVEGFEIWTEKDGKLEVLYKQDEIAGLRYCYLDEMTTDNLIVRAFAVDGKFNVNKFEMYNIQREQKDFRTTTYLPIEQFLNDYKENPSYAEGLNHVTDIILFGCAKYNEVGDLKVNDENIDKALSIINEIRKNNPKPANIYCDFVLNSEVKNEKGIANEKFFASLQKIALQENKNKLIKNLVDFTKEKNINGISFDYECPYTFDDYKVFSDFLVDMKAAAPNNKLAIAVAPWGLKFNKEAKEAVDVFEVMAYDLMDKRGNHSGWQNCCIDAVDYMVKKGYPAEKIDLGIPFYSRPIDYGAKWDSWRGDVDKISKFGNYTSFESIGYEDDAGTRPFWTPGKWYNGENLVMDKTAYCYDYGVGGIMIFQYNCDVVYGEERSLMSAINSVFE